jgi:PEP-CTERM motif
MKTTTARLIPLVAALAFAFSPAAHAANLVTDGGFEATGASFAVNGTYCYIGYAPIDCSLPSGSAWAGDVALIKTTSSPWQNPSSLGGFGTEPHGDVVVGLQNTSFMKQTVALTAGTYTLTWTDAGRGYGDTNNYSVTWDGNTLGSFATASSQAWGSHSLTFMATGAGVLTFKGAGPGPDGTSFIDNVSVTAAVPEAGTWALMLLGLTGVAAAARRRA